MLRSLGLPTSYAAGRFPALLDAMRIDKKSRGDQLRFVVLDGIGRPRACSKARTPHCCEAAYDEVSEVAS